MGELQLRFLGASRAILDGAPVTFRRRYSVALLAYLVLTRQPHSRADLAALLSSNLPEPSARKLLRNALADLKQHGLGDHVLIERDQVSFDTSQPYTLDVDDLDAIDTRGANAGRFELEWVTEHIGAELLAGLEQRNAEGFTSWLTGERAARRQQIVRLAIHLLERYEHENQLEPGIQLVRRLIEVAPRNEGLHRRLMRLLARGGRIDEALQHYQHLSDLLAIDGACPEAETADVFDLLSHPSTPPHNLKLPVAPESRILGRDDEVSSILQNLNDPWCRLLSITGMQGSGRTSLLRLVVEALAKPRPVLSQDPFADGLYLVQLDQQHAGEDPHYLINAIRSELGLPNKKGTHRLDQLTDYLVSRRVLLALDGFEHSPESTRTIYTLLRHAPRVTILLTARTPLAVPGEWIHTVSGLPGPAAPGELELAPASQLFLRETRRVGANVRPADAGDILRICRQTGGHPLAISIAAGWSRIVPTAEIVRQLEQGGPILSEPAIFDHHHRVSIQQIVEAEWNLLEPHLQQAVSRLATFRDRFDYDASLAVEVGPADLQELGYWSLLDFDAASGYLLHPLFRTFGAARLAEDAVEERRIRSGAAKHYAALLVDLTNSMRQERDAQTALDRHMPNLQGVWDWAVSQLDAPMLSEMLSGMTAWSEMAGQHRTWADILARSSARLRAGLATDPDREAHRLICKLLLAETDAIQWEGEFDRSVQCLELGLTHARIVEDPQLLASIELRQARVLHYQCKEENVLELLEDAHANAILTEDQQLLSNCRMMLGMVCMDYGQFQDAEVWLGKAEHTFQTLGDSEAIARIHLNLGRLYLGNGSYRRARLQLEQCIHTSQELLDRPVEAWALAYLARVHADGYGQHDLARLCLDRAHTIERDMTERMFSSFLYWVGGREAMQAGDTDRAQTGFEQSLAIGRDLASPFSIARALSGLGQLALIMDSPGIAENLAEQAVQIAEDAGRHPTVAAGLLVIGRAREARTQPEQAAAAYQQARNIAIATDMPHILCEATAGLVSTALTQGDLQSARHLVPPVVQYLTDAALAGCEDPAWIVTTCLAAFEECGDSRAADVLESGLSILRTRLASLPVPEQDRYLDASPARRALRPHLTKLGFA